MARMVPDTGEPGDHLGDARQRPDGGREPLRARSRTQRLLDGRQLCGVQLGLPSGATGRFQAGPAGPFPRVVPVVRADPRDDQRLRHLDL